MGIFSSPSRKTGDSQPYCKGLTAKIKNIYIYLKSRRDHPGRSEQNLPVGKKSDILGFDSTSDVFGGGGSPQPRSLPRVESMGPRRNQKGC